MKYMKRIQSFKSEPRYFTNFLEEVEWKNEDWKWFYEIEPRGVRPDWQWMNGNISDPINNEPWNAFSTNLLLSIEANEEQFFKCSNSIGFRRVELKFATRRMHLE